jgi:hypothetical protein
MQQLDYKNGNEQGAKLVDSFLWRSVKRGLEPEAEE